MIAINVYSNSSICTSEVQLTSGLLKVTKYYWMRKNILLLLFPPFFLCVCHLTFLSTEITDLQILEKMLLWSTVGYKHNIR